jgi:hypothetical protein
MGGQNPRDCLGLCRNDKEEGSRGIASHQPTLMRSLHMTNSAAAGLKLFTCSRDGVY